MDGATRYNKMTPYYKEMLEKGLEFQDFISIALLKELGISLTMFGSQKYQLSRGENIQGIEIKFDDIFKKSGNLYIETHEKSKPENTNFIRSGIFRTDNTWLYLIGNYEEVFIFSKKMLILLESSNRFFKVKTTTSKGFLIKKDDAEKYAARKIVFNE